MSGANVENVSTDVRALEVLRRGRGAWVGVGTVALVGAMPRRSARRALQRLVERGDAETGIVDGIRAYRVVVVVAPSR